jgi:hypothetical protein
VVKPPKFPLILGAQVESQWEKYGKIWKNASKVDKPSIFPYFSHIFPMSSMTCRGKPRLKTALRQALKAPSHAPAPQLLRMPELGPNRREILGEIVDFHYIQHFPIGLSGDFSHIFHKFECWI